MGCHTFLGLGQRVYIRSKRINGTGEDLSSKFLRIELLLPMALVARVYCRLGLSRVVSKQWNTSTDAEERGVCKVCSTTWVLATWAGTR